MRLRVYGAAGRRPRRGAKSAQELCLPRRLSQANHSCRGDGKNNRTSPGHDCESAGRKAKSPITGGDYRPGPVAFDSALRRTSFFSIASHETARTRVVWGTGVTESVDLGVWRITK